MASSFRFRELHLGSFVPSSYSSLDGDNRTSLEHMVATILTKPNQEQQASLVQRLVNLQLLLLRQYQGRYHFSAAE